MQREEELSKSLATNPQPSLCKCVKEVKRTGNGTGTLVTTRSTSSLVRSDGSREILLILQNLC